MPRKRYLKPSFNDDDDIKGLSDSARLLYALLWGHMDRHGVIEDSVLSIRSKVYPREDRPLADVTRYLNELLATGPSGRPRLYRFQWGGKSYFYAPTMPRHQKIYSDEPALIPMSALELAKIVSDFESSKKSLDAVPQLGSVPCTVHSLEQKVSGEHLSTGGSPEQAQAFSSASALNSSSALTSAQSDQNAFGDKSQESSDNLGRGGVELSNEVTEIIDNLIAKGRNAQVLKLIQGQMGSTQECLRTRYRDWLEKYDPGGLAVREGSA